EDFESLLPGFAPAGSRVSTDPSTMSLALPGFALLLAAVVLFSAWPFLARSALRDDRATWLAAALAGPAWFLPLKRLFVAGCGEAAIGLLPVLLAAIALAEALGARRTLAPG